MKFLRVMTAGLAVIGLAAAALAALNFEEGRGLRQLGEREKAARAAQTEIARWPEEPRLAAIQYLEAYGAPDEVSAAALVWRRRGDWLWLAVRRDAGAARDQRLLQHAVRYDTDTAPQNNLKRMKAGVEYEPIGGVLVVSSDSEPANILALNLAVDVIEGRLSPEEAGVRYLKTLELAASGKSSESMRRLLFTPARATRSRRPGQFWPL